MIEITLKNLLDSTDVLKKLSQKPLKGRVAYNVAKILCKVEEEFNLFNETRHKIVEQYGEKDDNGELLINYETHEYIFSDENLTIVNEEISNILSSMVSLNVNKIELDDLENVDFTPAEMLLIQYYINE